MPWRLHSTAARAPAAQRAAFPTWAGIAVLLLFAFPRSTLAQATREYEVKAVLIVNLVRFATWPESSFSSTNAPLVIGILGKDPFGRALEEAAEGERYNGHPLKVERFASVDSSVSAHLLFISRSERNRLDQILGKLDQKPVITISDIEDFTSLDGMVQLYINVQNRPRLRINLKAAKAQNIQFTSKLLQISEIIGKP